MKYQNHYSKLNFCTAGIPITTPKPGILNGLSYLREINLDGIELEFVRGVNMSDELAQQVNKQRKKLNLELTAHGPYYINLNAKEKAKYEASKKRIYDTAYKLNKCGGKSITFHAGYYLNQDKEQVYQKIKQGLKEIVDRLKEESNPVYLRPELTGKETQFGNIDELIKISQELEQVLPCIDFAHQHARTGKYNSYEDFSEILNKLEKGLGKEILRNLHMHFSGIEYTEKGEKRHLTLEDSDFNYKELAKALKDYKVKGVIISESPNIEKDALLLKEVYNKT